ADLKHSLIDPQGDFVKINEPDTEGKTRVITDEEVGAIKTTRSSVKNMLPKKIFQRKDLKEELESMDGTSLEDDEAEEEEEAAPAREKEPEQKKEIFRQKRRKLKKRRNISRAVPIALLILGAVFLVWLIMYIGRAAGLLGGDGNQNTGRIRTETAGNDQEDALVVPDLVGMTEAEAQEAANEVHLGIKFSGQEPSIQEKNRISRTVPSAGTPVQENSTVVYYLSTGSPDVTIPQELSNYRGIDAEQALKDMGLSVTVRKEYPELDDQGSALVEPGYVYYTEPAVGSQVKAGDNVNLVISRGINYGDGAEVPDVTGKNKNEAVTTLGKWIDIRIEEVQSDTVPEEEVISQSLEAGTLADPDQPITLTVSCGNRTPQSAETVQDTGSASVDSEQLEAEAAAAAAGEVWKCTQRLNVPEGYNGEQVKMELVQEVGGEVKTTTILEGEPVSFPYQLDLTGAPGVSGGILYVYQINSEGNYYELGHYRITFDKVG
ncbi:MAG: PASTA domain-containing protein, partial [Blautia sp.]|nr:PASTA domain-containing protein [Blautia sp.]